MWVCVFVGEIFLLRLRNNAKMTIFFPLIELASLLYVCPLLFFALSLNRKVPKQGLAGFKSSHIVSLAPKYISSKDTSSDNFKTPPGKTECKDNLHLLNY